ncbi:bacteriophage abortive infection AbiH family protein [Mucilaginibacter puniceus]
MKSLYIIGNGFDLYHGLPSRYADFHQYVSEFAPELLNRLDAYFDFEVDQNYLWRNFEQDLCKFDHEGFMDTYNHIDVTSESFKLSELYGLEDEVTEEADNLVTDIREQFTDWIGTFDFEEIDRSSYIPVNINTGALFINFNYTDTLEELYSIPKERILYIHNNANAYDGEMIFGHSEVSDHADTPTFDEDGEPTRTMYTDSQNASRAPFYAFQKDTKAVLKQHRLWFADLKDLDEVTILGHSLGKVDWPYLRLIHKLSPKAKWKVSYYGNQERIDLQKRIRSIGRHINCEMITFHDLT